MVLDIVRSMADKELFVELYLVGSPLFKSISDGFSSNFSIVFPRLSVCDDPHKMFLLLKSPRIKKGFGSCIIIEFRSRRERGVVSGI